MRGVSRCAGVWHPAITTGPNALRRSVVCLGSALVTTRGKAPDVAPCDLVWQNSRVVRGLGTQRRTGRRAQQQATRRESLRHPRLWAPSAATASWTEKATHGPGEVSMWRRAWGSRRSQRSLVLREVRPHTTNTCDQDRRSGGAAGSRRRRVGWAASGVHHHNWRRGSS